VLAIAPEGVASLRYLPASDEDQAEQLNMAVGGWLEAIGPGRWLAFVNSEGKRLSLERNFHADALARALGWHFQFGDYLVGAVVFASREGVKIGTVPDDVIDLARAAKILITGQFGNYMASREAR
jgi:hypothetical protein